MKILDWILGAIVVGFAAVNVLIAVRLYQWFQPVTVRFNELFQ